MSEPKRYGHKAIIYPKSDDDTYITIPVEQEDGQWVAYSDYARLKAEVERLTTENESLQTKSTNIYNAMVVRCKVEEITHKAKADSIISQSMMSEAMKMIEESVAIREQVERLTKAGDAFYESEIGYYGEQILNDPKHHSGQMCRDWNAAKEGKPSA